MYLIIDYTGLFKNRESSYGNLHFDEILISSHHLLALLESFLGSGFCAHVVGADDRYRDLLNK